MREEKPIIDAELLKIVHYEVRQFTGRCPLRKSEGGKQGAIVDDLVSAGNEALMRAVEHFDPSRRVKFKTFASACVRNAIRRAARPRRSDLMGHEPVSLDAPVNIDDELSDHHEVIADETVDHDFQISEAAWRCLQRLMPPREFDVLLSRWSGDKHREIAQRLGVSKERTRQIEVRALQRAADLYRMHADRDSLRFGDETPVERAARIARNAPRYTGRLLINRTDCEPNQKTEIPANAPLASERATMKSPPTELRSALNATLFYEWQMLDALAVVRAHQSPPSFWKYRDELRFLEAKVRAKARATAEAEAKDAAGANREPTDWQDALTIAARLAMLELGMKPPQATEKET